MRNTVKFLLIVSLLFVCGKAFSQEVLSREYKIKAAYIYNFFKVIEWPDEIVKEKKKKQKPLVVAIIGDDPFHKAIDVLEQKKIEGLKIKVLRIPGPSQNKKIKLDANKGIYPAYEKLERYDVVFICASEKLYAKAIMKSFNPYGMLTVSEYPGFLQDGGIVNFVMEKNNCKIEINLVEAKKAKLKISSKLLRIAKRIIASKKTSTENVGDK